ncbi:MAG: antitoxin [bacterium]|nr:antitoxin [bacterium]MDE0644378.1 antitoxin [bacterium]MYD04113.1 antitoxin [Acidimicrobiia bacterium]MYH55480.1 antitoxin [Acidimicrobiia bacterium]
MTTDILASMAKRLQVLLDEAEYLEIRRAAEMERMSIAEWVRQTLRAARRGEAERMETKLRALADAVAHDFPTGDIDEMLADIEAGRTRA